MSPRLLCNVVYALLAPPLGTDERGVFDVALAEPVGAEASAERALVAHLGS